MRLNERLKAQTDLLVACLLLISLILLVHPYTGIRHDSTLYFGQALYRIYPADFGKDLFFEFGSQAQFTLYPQILAWLLPRFTPGAISMTGILIGYAFIAAASWSLIERLIDRRFRYWALLFLMLMPHGYGGFSVFAYAEPFLTGRTFADPLVLLGLLMLIAGRSAVSLALLAVAATIHPLQAIAGMTVWWIHMVFQNRRWLHLLWLSIPALALGAAGIEPFAGLLRRYDDEWYGWLVEANGPCFILQWPPECWGYLATDFFIVWVASTKLGAAYRIHSRNVLLASALGITLSLALADGLRLVLPTGLQLWRIQWILHWTAMVAAPMFAWMMWRNGGENRVRSLLFLAIVIMGAPVGRFAPTLTIVILIPLYLFWPSIAAGISKTTRSAVYVGVTAALILSYSKYVAAILPLITRASANRGDGAVALLLHPLVLAATVLFLVVKWNRGTIQVKALLLAGATLLFLHSAANWDKRSNWHRHIEREHFDESPFGVKLEPGVQVYWINELLTPWLVLKRPSYFNGIQEAGLLFNRATAQEAKRRETSVALTVFQGELCSILNSVTNDPDRCAPDETALQAVCEEAAGGLQYIVLTHKLNVEPRGSWSIPKEAHGDRAVTYQMYHCQDIERYAAQNPISQSPGPR